MTTTTRTFDIVQNERTGQWRFVRTSSGRAVRVFPNQKTAISAARDLVGTFPAVVRIHEAGTNRVRETRSYNM